MLSDFILLVILIIIVRSVVRVSVVEESKYVIVLVCVKHFLPSLTFPGKNLIWGLNKSSNFAAANTKFARIFVINLVALCCAT